MIKKYDKYKLSGIEWLEEIPNHWRKLKIGRSFNKIGSGTTPKSGSDLFYENGVINWLNTGDLNDSYITETKKKITEAALNEFSTLKLYPPNSIVIALYGATIGKLGQLKIETTTNQACCVLSDSDDIENRYLFYYFLGARDYIISKAYGGGQPNISQDLIKQLYIPAPTKTEQSKIVQYLDYQTSIVDHLVQQKEKLIELLKEKRQAVINEAVTKGLNPKAKMKESGIEWLGEIPETWHLKKLSYNTYMKGRIGWQGLKHEEFIDEGPYLITGMNFKDGVIRWDEVYHISKERYDEAPEIQLKEGDVLMTKDGTIGKLLFIDNLPGPTSLNSHLLVLRPTDKSYIPKFLYYQLMSQLFFAHIELNKTGTTFYGITQESMGRYKMLLPSIEEQIEIVKFIEKSILQIEQLSFELSTQIEKLKEFRQTIISEAVTGKIDVREWQPNKQQVA